MASPLLSIKLHYDKYEYEFGDGFYPQFSDWNGKPETFILVCFEFIKERNTWKQVVTYDHRAITGLDPPYGEELLSVLNIEGGKEATRIENMWNKIIHQ